MSLRSGAVARQITTMSGNKYLDSVARLIAPPLSNSLHKGQSGRICVVGGSREYTGAPYFAGISALKSGVDIAHIVCTRDAGAPLKTLSPELIVHPALRSTAEENVSDSDTDKAVEYVNGLLPRVHGVLVGSGLGRDPAVLKQVTRIIHKAKELRLPLVLDGDAIFLLTQNIELITGYNRAILTPNMNEFKSLAKALKLAEDATLANVCEKLTDVTIVQKGPSDRVSDGTHSLEVDIPGMPRRCGGQGDITAGLITSLWTWSHLPHVSNASGSLSHPASVLSAYSGCYITRLCAEAAFAKHKRSVLASHLIEELPNVINKVFP